MSAGERQFQAFVEVSNSLNYRHARPRLIPRFDIHVPGAERSGPVVNRGLDVALAYVAQTEAWKILWIFRYCGSGVLVVPLGDWVSRYLSL